MYVDTLLILFISIATALLGEGYSILFIYYERYYISFLKGIL